MSGGDIRLPGEEGLPIKAVCVDCNGDGWYVGARSVMRPRRISDIDAELVEHAEPEQVQCERCQMRGYYFLPLGN